MTEVTIVAIPTDDSYVRRISSEKVPHLTILYLGDVTDDEQLIRIQQFLFHAAETTFNCPFGMSVERRGELGPDRADVIFFRENFAKDVFEFRHSLLLNDDIAAAYNSTPQYESWVPHLTLGYPDTPANPDNREYPGIHWVDFDRIAMWVDDYNGPEIFLKEKSSVMMSDTVTDFLAHYGVKGMKWGVRRAGRVSKPSTPRVKSQDHLDAQAIRKKRVYEMSNAELRKLNERMQLEKTYSQLMTTQGSTVKRGQRYVKDGLSVVKTVADVYNTLNSPAAVAAKAAIASTLKK